MALTNISQIDFGTVVAGVDGRSGGREALALASALLAPGGRLILTNVVRPRGAARLSALFADADRRAATQMLERERQRLGTGSATTAVALSDSVPEGLHSIVARYGADLLVVGSAHRGPVGRVMLGDDARGALNGARCAVAVAPHGTETPPMIRTIGVGDDGSPESALALSAARMLAARHGATVRACSVVGPASLSYRELSRTDPSDALLRRTEAEERRLARHGDVEIGVLQGEAGETLAEFGREVDLLVIGSRGQGPRGRLVTGSTAAHLIGHATCPLLILPRSMSPSRAPEPDVPSPGPRAPAAAARAAAHPAG